MIHRERIAGYLCPDVVGGIPGDGDFHGRAGVGLHGAVVCAHVDVNAVKGISQFHEIAHRIAVVPVAVGAEYRN